MIIAAGEVELEAVLWEPRRESPRAAALMCHPHPLSGGTMNNRVIYRAAKGAAEAGLAALRFNFRGVGASSGAYDKGLGERKDAAALVDWLQQRYPGLPLALVGFSFGAWVGLQVGCHDPRIQALIGLGLPLNSYDFDFLAENAKPALLITGTRDEFCPRDKMELLARRLPQTSDARWVEGADHFFTHQADQVQSLVKEFLRTQFEGHHKP
ncbi:MAG: alpha/beta fold hydrolase [Acidobacteriota bacterium]